MQQPNQQGCYVILCHQDAPPHERYKNRWLDRWRIDEILTEPWVAEECRKAGSVYIYRCRYADWPPCIACQAEVDTIGEAAPDDPPSLVRVRFKNARKMNEVPPFKAKPGDICKSV